MEEYIKKCEELERMISQLIGENAIVINENHFAVYAEKNDKIISMIKTRLNWGFVKMKGDAEHGTIRMIFQREDEGE